MEIEFKMPDLATTDSEMKVVRWLVAVGQPVKRGQALLEVETDKSMMEVESIATGTLQSAHAGVGDAIVSGQLIAVIATAGTPPSAPVAPAATPASAPPTAEKPKPAGGMFARNRAANRVGDTGKPAASGPMLSATQRTVGRRMQESKQSAPHFYLQASVNAEPMRRARAAADAGSIAWEAFFAQAAARALARFERMGWRLQGESVRTAGTADIGVAVDHEGELYVIALADPAAHSVAEISRDLRAKVEQVRRGDPEARKLRPAVLTITNLGATRVEAFTAIVNPPEAAILAVGRVAPVPVVENGAVVIQHRATLTLSADHRVVNGKYAADYLTDVVQLLESL